MSARGDPQKIGSEHLKAMGRLGLNELRAAAYPDSNIARPVTEYGIYGTATPGEVAEARRGEDRGLDEESSAPRESILGERLRQAEGRGVHGQKDKELSRER